MHQVRTQRRWPVSTPCKKKGGCIDRRQCTACKLPPAQSDGVIRGSSTVCSTSSSSNNSSSDNNSGSSISDSSIFASDSNGFRYRPICHTVYRDCTSSLSPFS